METARAIDRMIAGENLSGEEVYQVFEQIMKNETNSMTQGGFLAAMTAKGATAEEISAIQKVIYDLDTVKVKIKTDRPLVENSGTGMDRIKTFNISTAASIVAAACGAAMTRHGSRGITSKCGTVDVCEALGIDAEAETHSVGRQIETCGIGLFNGMSAKVHPHGLARILSELKFGTVLNIAASLANPAAPKIGVRGVNEPKMISATAEIMVQMGYEKVLIFHGFDGEDRPAMDEVSVLGKTAYLLIDESGMKTGGVFIPKDFGLTKHRPEDLLTTGDPKIEAKRIVRILKGQGTAAERDAVIVNTAVILWTAGLCQSVTEGCQRAASAIDNKQAWYKLIKWVGTQSDSNPNKAIAHLENL